MYTKIVKWHSLQQIPVVISPKSVSRDEVGTRVETLFDTGYTRLGSWNEVVKHNFNIITTSVAAEAIEWLVVHPVQQKSIVRTIVYWLLALNYKTTLQQQITLRGVITFFTSQNLLNTSIILN
jgi:hypothetical protein